MRNFKGLTQKYPGMFNREVISFLVESFQEVDLSPQALAILQFNLKEHPRSGSAKVEIYGLQNFLQI